jgi:small conductance mechanosensitive channel
VTVWPIDLLLTLQTAHSSLTHNAIVIDFRLLGLLVGVPIAILVATYFVSRYASRMLRGTLNRAGIPINIAILLARVLWVAVWALGVLGILEYLGIGFALLATFVGVLGLAASLSLQTVLQNLVAGVYLLVERPFAINDTILVVGANGVNHEGKVEDIEMRTTHLRSPDNELILVPNAAIFSGVVTNRTAIGGFASEATLTFPRNQDPTEVQEAIRAVIQDIPGVLSTPQPILRVEKVGADNWTASLAYWVTSRKVISDVTWAIGRGFPDATVNEPEVA